VWSASRLEAYGTCPFNFYAASALELEVREPPEPGFDAAQLGSMLHHILERAYRETADHSSLPALLAALESAAADEFAEAPQTYGFRPTALWEAEQEQLLEALKETVSALEEQSQDWRPLAFEQAFGIGGRPPMPVGEGAQRLLLRGFIDRVDRNAEGQIRIIDYKTGSSHMSRGDLLSGRRLQLPLYAWAARGLGLGEPAEGFYWQILQARRSPLRLQDFKVGGEEGWAQGPEAAMALAAAHAAEYARRIRAGQFPPQPPYDGCPPYCPAVGWCWRYEAGWWGT
jgi:ATP-dependent helicase/nuclease subunit B